ncbi:hypothetical protein [Actinoplanes aureus]|uniref:SHOCT domain-containing protein n=1 Tax=Actinoplanes aureus TaxID=2792083 RepID=A0A931FWC4_9ACTN|nr:hypothetical protein [Actinoplanes aureus]MBG0562288.1 hypothetical protein [Actinoplanes aureus]
MMMLLLVVIVGLIVAAVLSLWPAPGAPAGREETPDEPGPASANRPSSLEGVIVEQLMRGEITRRQYLRAVERIAARDEHRHPLNIPE